MSSAQTSEIELTQIHHPSISDAASQSIGAVEANDGFTLPPVDGASKESWLFLLACFMLEAFIWGFPSSYGVFQEYYSANDFKGSGSIAVVGTCALGIMYMDIILYFCLLKYFPKLRIWSTPIGLVIMCLALGLGSLAKSVNHLIMTQGVLYAIGGGFAWTPILFFIEEWWVRRRGFAYGATMAGLGMSGAILPLILEWLLNSWGFRTTLRVSALAMLILNGPILLFFKPRLPLSQSVQSRRFDMSFWSCSNFLILQSGNIIQSLGYFLPSIYLPTFARTLGASSIESIATVILLNAAAFVGSLVMGAAVDKYKVTTCILVSAVGSAIGVFLLWGLATSLPLLYVFCIVYGAFAGCSASSWSAIIRDTQEKKGGADSGMVFGALSAGKGVGNLLSGPLSEALLHAGNWKAGMAYGSGYGPIIVFTGVTALLSGWGYAARRIGWM